MRIDSPKGIKSWLIGFFSGSFKGDLTGNVHGTSSYAVTASYVESASCESASYAEVAGEANYAELAGTASEVSADVYSNLVTSMSATFIKVTGSNQVLRGDLTIEEPNASFRPGLTVHGRMRNIGNVEVTGNIEVTSGSINVIDGAVNIGSSSLEYKDNFLEVKFS